MAVKGGSAADGPGGASAGSRSNERFPRGNYAPVADELTERRLPVVGSIPVELAGCYMRNGPNARQAAGHWFTGDGMIHGVRIEGGRAAWYRNRWVRTESFQMSMLIYNEDGSRNLRSSTANTNIIRHAGRTLALVETSLPYEVTKDLCTIGPYDFGGKLNNSMTAHPKICPITGELHFFGYGSIEQPHVIYHRANRRGQLLISRPLEVPALTMMHDFALTAHYLVFLDLPLVFDLDIATKKTSSMPFRWDDSYGARLGVLRRDKPFERVRWFDIEPCFITHVANAYDEHTDTGETVVLHAVRYAEIWREPANDFGGNGQLWSWKLNLRTGRVAERQIDDRSIEFPRIDDRRTGLPARFVVTTGRASIVRYDLHTDNAVEHHFGTQSHTANPSEAVFVPSRSSTRQDEDQGWYMCFVHDPARQASDLTILDSSDLTGSPVARIRLPCRVPVGLHGSWVPD